MSEQMTPMLSEQDARFERLIAAVEYVHEEIALLRTVIVEMGRAMIAGRDKPDSPPGQQPDEPVKTVGLAANPREIAEAATRQTYLDNATPAPGPTPHDRLAVQLRRLDKEIAAADAMLNEGGA